MSTLYIIGGSPRSGKTIIFEELIHRNPMIAIQTDPLREGVRYAVTGEPVINISKLSFEGDVTFHRSGESKDVEHVKHFSTETTQDELTWKTIVGIISYYDAKNISLVIEGMIITPEKVKDLNLKNLKPKVAFLGFTDKTYFDSILTYANVKKDWIYKKIQQEHGGDDSAVRDWFNKELENNQKIAQVVEEYGYRFFSPDNIPFEEYRDSVVEYLLS